MTTRDYEALVIVRSAGTEQEMAKAAGHLEGPIKKVGGSVTSSQNLGRRKLAFRISKQAEGVYFLLRFQAPTAELGEIKRLFRLEDSVVRFMILNADDTVPTTSITTRLPSSASRGPSRNPASMRS